jgi:hypothetical protein
MAKQSADLTNVAISRSCMAFTRQPKSVNRANQMMMVNNPQALTRIQAAFQQTLEWKQGQVLFVGFVMENVQRSNNFATRVEKINYLKKTIDDTYTDLMNLRFVWVPDNWDEVNVSQKELLNGRKLMTANVIELQKQGMSEVEIDAHLQNIASNKNEEKQVPMIRISFNAQGAYSYVGNVNAQIRPFEPLGNPGKTNETMGLGWLDEELKGGVIKHEFGHCIGLMHEHQRDDATGEDKLDFIDQDALYAFFAGPPNNWDNETIQNNVLSVFKFTTKNASKYDPTSIMHYIMDCNMFKNHKGPTGLQCTVPMCPKENCCEYGKTNCNISECNVNTTELQRIKLNLPGYECGQGYDTVNNTQVLSLMDKQTIGSTYPPRLVGKEDLYATNTATESEDGTSTDSRESTATDSETVTYPMPNDNKFPKWGWAIIAGVVVLLIVMTYLILKKQKKPMGSFSTPGNLQSLAIDTEQFSPNQDLITPPLAKPIF